VAEINWTAEAERWLRDIYDYIAQDKLDTAVNVVSAVKLTVIPAWIAGIQFTGMCS
jgi:plasmid stabilization system protein ParE